MEAKAYAIESISHTMDYDGWKDGHAKMVRIATGKYVQVWLYELCRLNGFAAEKDRSSPTIHDDSDLLINGWAIDCKASMVPGLECQISPHFDSQKKSIDYYAFFQTNKSTEFVLPLGFISYINVKNSSTVVEKGDVIPGTNITQRFSKSYFVRPDALSPFYKHLHWLSQNPKNKTCRQAADKVVDYQMV